MACHTKANINEAKFSDTISENISFITFNNIKEILKRKVRKQIEEEIKQSEYLIVRLPSFIGLMSLRYIKN